MSTVLSALVLDNAAAILQVRIDIITVQSSAALPDAPVEPWRLPYASIRDSIGVMVRCDHVDAECMNKPEPMRI